MNEYFKEQLDNGATDNFFYGTEHNGEVKIKRHRGSLDTFPTTLKFLKMMGPTPFFKPTEVEE
jgi:hypothetical protein